MVKVKKDLTGQKFGRLTVIRQVEDYVNPNTGKRSAKWERQCECGGKKVVVGSSLLIGDTQSCGCIVRGNKVGETSYSKYGTKATLIKYIDSRNVLIEFDDEFHYQYATKYENFVHRHITNPYDRTIYGVGCFGVGTHMSSEHSYYTWHCMLERCYKKEKRKSEESYIGCTVCEDWKVFQNFADWYDEHFYECPEGLMIDKDFMSDGNKYYSPETCVLVPKSLNLSAINSFRPKWRKGSNEGLPIGVEKQHNSYIARICAGGYPSIIGCYKTVQEAETAYKTAKRNYLLSLLNIYENVMPNELFTKLKDRINIIYETRKEE